MQTGLGFFFFLIIARTGLKQVCEGLELAVLSSVLKN
jgi:hypothetical protein